MIESILVYGFMITCFCLYGTKAGITQQNNNSKKFWTSESFIILFVFALFCGLRNNVGVDYYHYLQDYLHTDGSWRDYSETMYGKLVEIMSKLGIHYFFYFALIAFLQLFFTLYAFKDERKLYPYLLFVIMTNGTYFMWMNGMRQCLAICLFLFATRFIKDKKPIKYLLVIAVSFFIHKSSLLLVPFFLPFFSKDLFKNKIIQISLVVVAIFLVDVPFWQNFMGQIENVADFLGYTEDNRTIEERFLLYEDVHYTKGLRFYISVLIGVISILNSDKIKETYDINLFYNFFYVGLLTSILFYNNPLLSRASMYFIYVQFVVIAYTLLYFKQNSGKTNCQFLYWSVIVLLLLYFIAYVASNWYTYYYFIWQTPGKLNPLMK